MSISLAWVIYLLYFHKHFSTSSWTWWSEILPWYHLVLLLALVHFYWIWLCWFCLQDYFEISSHPPFCLGKPTAVWSQSNRLLIPLRTDSCRAKLAWCWRQQPDVSQRQIYLHVCTNHFFTQMSSLILLTLPSLKQWFSDIPEFSLLPVMQLMFSLQLSNQHSFF